MSLRFKRTMLTAAAAVGFAGVSTAAEPPLVLKPAEMAMAPEQTEKKDDDARAALVLVSLIAAGAGVAYALTRKRSMFGDEDRDPPQ